MFGSLSTLDIIIVAGYFGIVFFLAYWVTMQERRKKLENYGSSDYFLGGKNVGWFVIGASLFASNIGSEHLVGLAGSGAKGDFVSGQFELLASLILILLGWVFVPFYIKSGVFTMPEFLEKRYNSKARNYLSIVSILAYILTKISLTILAGAIVFSVMGLEFWTGALLVVVATGVYTIFGGLRAVIYTDMLQMFVLVGGAIAITVFGVSELGGWDGVTSAVSAAAGEQSLNADNFFNLWRPADDPDFPWTGIFFGAPILGVWYWCTDQFIVQRVLSAKDVSNARKGTIFGGFLKLLPLFIFVIPGILAFALSYGSDYGTMQGAYQNDSNEWVVVQQDYTQRLLSKTVSIEGVDHLVLQREDGGTANTPVLKAVYDGDAALPQMIDKMLPPGLRGLVLAGLLAALMSSLSSVFNSCSTLFTIDFYKKWYPEAAEKRLVFVGQIATVVLVVLSLAWIPLLRTMTEGSSFYKVLQSIQAYISPPIAAAFLLGLFIKRINAKGAIWSLWTGFVLGIARLIAEVGVQNEFFAAAEGSFMEYFVGVNFLHYAIFLFVVCSIVMVLVSLTAPQHSDEKLKNVTYEKPEDTKGGFNTSNRDFWLTIALIAAVLILWLVFSPWGIV